MSQSSEMDQLVEVIANRVRSRLNLTGPVVIEKAEKSGGCGGKCGGDSCGSCSMPEQACGVCGVHSLHKSVDPAMRQPTGELSAKDIAQVIDHTYLKPDASRDEVENICAEAAQYHFFSVCVNSSMVSLARSRLHGTGVKVCAVVGFPLGAATPGSKAYEAREAIRCGADEIDMVMNIGAMKSRDYQLVEQDIEKVVKASQPRLVKVILETGMLTEEEKVIGCALSKAAGAHYVKTSTGFGPGGATVPDIELMRRVVGPDMGVKASGGVRDYAGALAVIRAGASRIGASSSIAIVTGGKGGSGY